MDATPDTATGGPDGFWDHRDPQNGARISPYRYFSAREWERFRADTPLTLTADEVDRLRSLGDPVSLEEVERAGLGIPELRGPIP